MVLFITNLFSVYYKIGGIDVGGAQDYEVQNNIAVVSTYSQEVQIFDLSCLSNPEMISSISLNDIPREIKLFNNYCYTVVRDTSIVIIDISDLQYPIYLNEFSVSSDDICEFAINEDIIYIFTSYNLIIVSLQDPMNPVTLSIINSINSNYQSYGIQYENDRIYLNNLSGLMIFDVSDPSNPNYANSYGESRFSGLQIIDNIAYLSDPHGFCILNIEDYHNIQLLSENNDYEFHSVFVDNGSLYSWVSINDISELYHFNIQDINNFIPIGSYSGGRVLKVDNDIVFTRTDGWQRADFEILDFSDPYNQYFVGEDYYRCNMKDIYVNNDFLGVCSRGDNDGVNFFDISDPSNPSWLWAHTLGQQSELSARTVIICDDYAIAGFSGGTLNNPCIRIYDVSNPQDIQIISGLELGDYTIYSIAVDENTAYVGCLGGLFSIDISDLTDPTILNCINNIAVSNITIDNNFLYACAFNSVQIYYIDDPNNPILCGAWESSNTTYALAIYNSHAYVSDKYGGLKILDISNPSNPYLVNTILPHFDSLIYAKPIIYDNKLVLSDSYWNELLIYDLSNAAFPELFYSFKWNRLSAELTTNEDYLITANDDSGFTILDLNNLTPASENVIANEEILLTNYPNPFNPTTTISFSIINDSNVELSIFNIKGQKIKTLANNDFMKGSHSIIWNGFNESGDSVSTGIYLYKLNVNGKTESMRKCLLLK